MLDCLGPRSLGLELTQGTLGRGARTLRQATAKIPVLPREHEQQIEIARIALEQRL